MTRACEKTNPSLWQRFIEVRKQLGEPPPKPEMWTSPQVWAWIDVRTYKLKAT